MAVIADKRDFVSRHYRPVEHELGQRALLNREISAKPPGWRLIELNENFDLPEEYRDLERVDTLEELENLIQN